MFEHMFFYPTKLGKFQADIEREDNRDSVEEMGIALERLETPHSELGRMETEHPHKDNSSLVGGAITILKNMSSSMGRIIPYIMENKKCLKPPTSSKMCYKPS